MANFRLTNTPPPMWSGGPDNTCVICKFVNPYAWYLVMDDVLSEEPHPSAFGGWVEKPVVLCCDHAAELMATLQEAMPDDRIPALQAQLFQAEAARARAEARTEAAEKALHAMQDWLGEPTVAAK
jgi:hypothetical protein